jgi:hypothetical protein
LPYESIGKGQEDTSKTISPLGMVAHAWNPSYSEGGGGKIMDAGQLRSSELVGPCLKNKLITKGLKWQSACQQR